MFSVAVVEDELLESKAICRILEDSDLNLKIVGVAASGKEAEELIDRTNPDVVLLDIKIPDKSGLEVLKFIKDKDPEKRVIMVTAYSEFDYAHQALKLHANDYLLKPIRPVQLINALKAVVENLESEDLPIFDEEINEILYNINNRKYSETNKSLQKYVNQLYKVDERNYDKMTKEVMLLIEKLSQFTSDLLTLPTLEIETRLKANPTIFKNQYELYQELKKVINLIFDAILDRGSDSYSIDDIINYIDRNCHRDISLNQVGDFANMSSYYLSKIFKKETGLNFVTYLTNRKIEMAKDMLVNTNIPIINIALELSYHEPNYFSKVFKKATGMTPTEYRREHKYD